MYISIILDISKEKQTHIRLSIFTFRPARTGTVVRHVTNNMTSKTKLNTNI